MNLVVRTEVEGIRKLLARIIASHFRTIDDMVFESGVVMAIRSQHQKAMDKAAVYLRSMTREHSTPVIVCETDCRNYPMLVHKISVFENSIEFIEKMEG